jgi:hypothetical protein
LLTGKNVCPTANNGNEGKLVKRKGCAKNGVGENKVWEQKNEGHQHQN